jgi:FecR protein
MKYAGIKPTVLCLLAVALTLSFGCEKKAEPVEVVPEPQKKVAAVQVGEVYAFAATATVNGNQAAKGMKIFAADRIETSGDGYIDILYDSGSILRAKAGASFTINYDKADNSATLIKLLRGAIQSVLKPNSNYRIQMLKSVAGVRGTDFFAWRKDEVTDYVCTCNGTVEITSLENPEIKETVTSTSHTARGILTVDGIPSITSDVEMDMLHNDELIAELKRELAASQQSAPTP